MLKTSLQLRLHQSLTLTPQLQQTIRLLQFSSLELQQQVTEMIEQNPMLEVEENAPAEVPAEAAEAGDGAAVEAGGAEDIPDELPLDTSWDAIYDSLPAAAPPASGDGSDYLENQAAAGGDVRQQLLEQLQLTGLSPLDRAIAEAIVLNLRNDGYLDDSLANIAQLVSDLSGQPVGEDEVRAMQHYVMQLEPVGCGALDPREHLLAQLRHRGADGQAAADARLLLERHFELVGKQNLNQLTRRTGLSAARVEAALSLIRSLPPRPASGLDGERTNYVVPDVYVTRHEGRWVVSLNPEVSPRLRVHPFYASLVRRGDQSDDNRYLREQLQEARWFIKSILSRNETILRVAEVIVDKQQAFFDQGEQAMQPMVLRDVAEVLGMHESTISRVTTSKYMLTPRGLFEFKYFFSSQLHTADGGNTSATAIKAIIRQLISDEDPQKPLSDSRIASILLDEKGIKVARRTVAKYREAMQIPPSNERKRIG